MGLVMQIAKSCDVAIIETRWSRPSQSCICCLLNVMGCGFTQACHPHAQRMLTSVSSLPCRHLCDSPVYMPGNWSLHDCIQVFCSRMSIYSLYTAYIQQLPEWPCHAGLANLPSLPDALLVRDAQQRVASQPGGEGQNSGRLQGQAGFH